VHFTNDIRDIKGLVSVPLEGWIWLLVAFVAGATALIFWVIRRHRQPSPLPVTPVPSAQELALAALERLRQDNPPVEMFYTRLSDIVRQYIEQRFGLHAPERTTEEFLAEATLPAHSMVLLEGFLREADLVKFARHRPGPHDAARAFGAAEKFVRETAS
jgi:hypothetical protein